MTRVSRAAAGQQNKNRLRFHRIKVFAQRFPGKIGTDAERAVTNTPDFRLLVDGRIAQTGKLGADGSAELFIPDHAKATLELFGTSYELEVLLALESENTLLGRQRRLNLLGYYEAGVDDRYGARTDAATLDFQADNGLEPDGDLLGAATTNGLRNVFGE